MQKINKHWLLFVVVVLFTLECAHLEHKISGLKRSFSYKVKKNRRLDRMLAGHLKHLQKMPAHLPPELAKIPLGEKNDIVLGVTTPGLRNAHAAHNASIIEKDDKFLLFFRYDLLEQMQLQEFSTHIGCAELDQDFNQTEKEWKEIDLHTTSAEDPRVVKKGNELLLFFNAKVPEYKGARRMYVAGLDEQNLSTQYTNHLDLYLKTVEKNWVPFLGSSDEVYFQYQLSPVSILHLTNPEAGEINSISRGESLGEFWPRKWGKPLGGTPGRLVDGQYISFFHSKFVDKKGMFWYVMGAYTFDRNHPEVITSVSEYPIMFEGIYDSKVSNTADLNKRVIYPSGFAIEEKDGKTLLHVACGENDSAIKIVTMDKARLIDSMRVIEKPREPQQ